MTLSLGCIALNLAPLAGQGSAIWNIIEINGLTMRQAISNWWHDTKPEWTTDCTWDPTQLDEPPKWTDAKCTDWKSGNNTGKKGCYEDGRSCCPPEQLAARSTRRCYKVRVARVERWLDNCQLLNDLFIIGGRLLSHRLRKPC